MRIGPIGNNHSVTPPSEPSKGHKKTISSVAQKAIATEQPRRTEPHTWNRSPKTALTKRTTQAFETKAWKGKS